MMTEGKGGERRFICRVTIKRRGDTDNETCL